MKEKPHQIEEKPPLFKSWNALYIILIGFLLFQIIFFYLLTRYLS